MDIDTKTLAKYAYFIGAAFAAISALIGLYGQQQTPEWANWVIILLGVYVGLFGVASDHVKALILLYLGLGLTHTSLRSLFMIGDPITAILQAYLGFLGPVVLTATLLGAYKYFRDNAISNAEMMEE